MYRARYILSSRSQGVQPLFNDPIGWDEDTRSLVRDSNSFGILYDFATDLEFVKDGYDFILATERAEGAFEARVFVKRQVKINEVWTNDYLGEIDLLKKTQTRLGVKVNLFNGGLTQEIKAVLSDKFELETLESVKGDTLDALELESGVINGRDLEVNTLLEDDADLSYQGIENFYLPKINRTFSGDPSVQGVFSTPLRPFVFVVNGESFPELNTTHPFLYRSREQANRLINLTIDCDIEFPFGGVEVELRLYKYKFISDSEPFRFVELNVLKTLNYNNIDGETQTVNETFAINQPVDIDETLVFTFFLSGFANPGNTVIWDITQRNFKIEITQRSIFPSTSFKGLTIKKAGERLSKIITGSNVFKTDYFTNNEFKDVLITSGKKIRNFPDSVELSLKHLFESCASVFNCYYGVETINEQERLVLEPLDYFFRPDILLDLGRVSDVIEKYNEKLIFNSLNVGYKKGGDYEENQGLDEYNTDSSFTHGFRNVDTKKDFLSDIRADTIGIELTRRKQFEIFPTEDTQQDKDNFFIDCYKLSTNILGVEKFRYFNRRFGVDFSELPTGIFSPETAYNLRLSPINNLFRNSNYLSYLTYFQSLKTRFVSAFRNSILVTKLIGGTARAENGDYINNVFKAPLFEPIEITFKYKLSDDQLSLLSGTTDGVPNYYKLIRFEDDQQQINYGYLMSYEPKDEGTFTVLKASLNQSEF
jgi:hypothetical protein